ncbi:MAG: peroxidase [Lewinellaceae bacterium]|nr:hypothetical protein [Lewinella sp.]MCB9277669.1 peroxidase [Lewinellaceae bacterium]
MKNHGYRTLRGLSPESASSAQRSPQARGGASNAGEGRFRRIFPASGFVPDPAVFAAVGAESGPMDGGINPDATADVPLGMIFLGQFIDHDITFDPTSGLDAVNDPDAVLNFRTPALDLDCVYGAGPGDSAYLYDESGKKLLTAQEGSAFIHQPVVFRQNDLCRNADGIAVIGDPRNDENRVISQLQLAFIRFHNKVMDKIQTADPNVANLRLPGDADDFAFAQRLVRWHFQWIVNNEFLPLLCGQTLVDQILDDSGAVDSGRKIYDPADLSERAFIPIEFAVAAYRFGHSMIAQSVKTKHTPLELESLFGQKMGSGFSPLSHSAGVIKWNYLFDINGSDFQRADRLDTKLATTLLNLPFIKIAPASLAERNLRRGASFSLASGEEVVDAINAQLSNHISKLTANEINTLSGGNFGTGAFVNNTPLWYYILAEAESLGNGVTGAGQGLGPAGGRIVAETLIGIQQKDATSYLCYNQNNPGAPWSPDLIQGPGDFTMADLLTYS